VLLVIGGIIVMWPGGGAADPSRLGRGMEGYRARLADVTTAGD
jgi:hypothetical protein